jgi:hypothetical protein
MGTHDADDSRIGWQYILCIADVVCGIGEIVVEKFAFSSYIAILCP